MLHRNKDPAKDPLLQARRNSLRDELAAAAVTRPRLDAPTRRKPAKRWASPRSFTVYARLEVAGFIPILDRGTRRVFEVGVTALQHHYENIA
jgi:hypothetical protein